MTVAVIIMLLAIAAFMLTFRELSIARDSQRLTHLRQLHSASSLYAAGLHKLPMPYQWVPISLGYSWTGVVDLISSHADEKYSVLIDANIRLSSLTWSRLLALAQHDGIETLRSWGSLFGAIHPQNLGWQGYVDASITRTLNSSEIVDPQNQTFFSYRLWESQEKSQFLTYLENPTYDEEDYLLWNMVDQVYADSISSSDYAVRHPYVFGDFLGVVLDKSTNAPVQVWTHQ